VTLQSRPASRAQALPLASIRPQIAKPCQEGKEEVLWQGSRSLTVRERSMLLYVPGGPLLLICFVLNLTIEVTERSEITRKGEKKNR
jgi:hypothetical protein